jgi:sirohydrochlorin cobaltochelatase
MLPRIKRVLSDWIAAGARGIGQIEIRQEANGFCLFHFEDAERDQLNVFRSPDDAADLAKFDDEGKYRPLKTAPNLQHGWRLELPDVEALQFAIELFYPGRLGILVAWEANCLTTTSLRTTLGRQTGMYRAAAKISDPEIEALVGRFCRSSGGEPGCLRTILWARDENGARPSSRLPLDKFIAPLDQTGRRETRVPLLCQEACNLLIAEARKVVKGVSDEPE